MDERTKQVGIVAAAAVIIAGMWLYFSPQQQCIRELAVFDKSTAAAECLRLAAGRR